jgi:hypothetical protein
VLGLAIYLDETTVVGDVFESLLGLNFREVCNDYREEKL